MNREELERLAISEYSRLLLPHGFSLQAIDRSGSFTTCLYVHPAGIGIELELDWHEYEAFTLVVLLDRGKPPRGYYSSDNMVRRKHLITIAKENDWLADGEIVVAANSLAFPADQMKNSILRGSALLSAVIERLLAQGPRLFSIAHGAVGRG